MSQVVTQNAAADIQVLLSDSNQAPVLGLLAADLTAEFRKEGDTSFTVKSLDNTSASITSGNAETYALTDGQTLDVAVDGGGAQTATFNTADFVDIANATAAEVALVIDTDVSGISAADVGGSVVITSDTTGTSSSVQITGGIANTALGFSTALQVGTQPLTEIGSGVYTVEFLASELDVVGLYTVKITGATIATYVGFFTVAAEGTAPTIVAIDTCVITGHVFELDGTPLQGASVSARVLGAPSLLSGTGLSEEVVATLTDANGEFFLSLARLVDVDLTIPKVNFRRQFTVPNQATANLFTDIP